MACELLCYNKGCGSNYDPNLNNSDSCTYHPGVPVFHDALKGWSCCKRRTTDFSEFLNIPGCAKGCHSNEKPKEPIVPKVSSSKDVAGKGKVVFESPTPKPINNVIKPISRPSANEPTIPLQIKSTPSILKALEKLSLNGNKQSDNDKQSKVCKHSSCKAVYTEGIDETCIHHPGVPVFHEGMKYWSCCKKKTSDFTAFLSQVGCVRGTHEWKLKSSAESTQCRYDWHQTGTHVVVSIFAKTAIVENCSIKVNQVKLESDVEYEGGTRNFKLNLELRGVIDPSRSYVTLFGTKVEITLRKADATFWKDLQMEQPELDHKGSEDKHGNAESKNEPAKTEGTNLNNRMEADDDSDLSGIDDVEFD